MDDNKQNQNTYKMVAFSKDNPVVEISSKQSQVQIQNIVPPVKPKELKKEWGDYYRMDYRFNK